MKQEKHEARTLCPLAGFAECRGERCALWDDYWTLCSLNSGSWYSGIRAAVCDAAMEVMGEYEKIGDGRGAAYTSSDPGEAGATFPPRGRLGEDGAVIDV